MVPESSKEERIASAADADRCPECGAPLGDSRVGSGRIADGIFCSLACLSTFHADHFELRRKHGFPTDN